MKPIYTITGIVEQGNKRGKPLGFPTINIPTTETMAEGIYFSQVLIQNEWHNALTFIGVAKTFGATDFLAETYILDFDKDLYGETVTVNILKKLRGNITFQSSEELIDQMKQDEKDARKFFAK